MSSATLTIVILNWKNAYNTVRCLDSLSSALPVGASVLVVDNGSSDGSLDIIRAGHPQVATLSNATNLGYTGGNNVGIRVAMARGSDYLLILNDDAVVVGDAVATMLRLAEEHSDVAFLGPRIHSLEVPHELISCGGFISESGHVEHLRECEHGPSESIPAREVDFVSGCALLVRCSALKEIGLLDETFFAYGEEIDWCYRSKQHGFRVLLATDAEVWHPDTRVRDEYSPRVTYYISRNHLLFLRKHRFGARALLGALLQQMLLVASWTIRTEGAKTRAKRRALCLATRDFLLNRSGEGPAF